MEMCFSQNQEGEEEEVENLQPMRFFIDLNRQGYYEGEYEEECGEEESGEESEEMNSNESSFMQGRIVTKKMSPNFQPSKNLIGRSYIVNDQGHYERIIRKRKRKSGDQLKVLMREFDRNPNWSKETLLEVSKKTGLSEAQVYKWGWD